jgi:hypothetical protein
LRGPCSRSTSRIDDDKRRRRFIKAIVVRPPPGQRRTLRHDPHAILVRLRYGQADRRCRHLTDENSQSVYRAAVAEDQGTPVDHTKDNTAAAKHRTAQLRRRPAHPMLARPISVNCAGAKPPGEPSGARKRGRSRLLGAASAAPPARQRTCQTQSVVALVDPGSPRHGSETLRCRGVTRGPQRRKITQ